MSATTETPATTSAPVVERSAMDGRLLFQLLVAEMEMSAGRVGQAYEITLDAARRTKDESLFRRAVQMAVQSRSIDQAQQATRTWRQTLPNSVQALQVQTQLALSSQRVADAVEPFLALVDKTPAEGKVGVINSLPPSSERVSDRQATANAFDAPLQTLAQQPALKAAALSTLARLWLSAGDHAKALALTEQAATGDARAREPAMMAIELMSRLPAAERLVKSHLDANPSDTEMRLAYGQSLLQLQRPGEALSVLQAVTTSKPDSGVAWLSLGAAYVELRQPREAEAALTKFLQIVDAPAAASTTLASDALADDADEANLMRAVRASAERARRDQAYLMLAQVAEQRGDLPAASAWLERVEGNSRGLDVALRRATLLVKQGKVNEARALIRTVPEASPADARAKVMAEGQVLREAKRWQEAYDVLGDGVKRFPKDIDLIYEQAMMAEKLERMDAMEKLLRQVIALKPDHHHAYNALGYSLADRRLRLPEARQLVKKALELEPGNPFIVDSLAWVEYRIGNHTEAIRLLRQAWATRPDTEIGAHLGEVLWVSGQKDEARRIWRDARNRDAGNDVLKETLKRLKVDL